MGNINLKLGKCILWFVNSRKYVFLELIYKCFHQMSKGSRLPVLGYWDINEYFTINVEQGKCGTAKLKRCCVPVPLCFTFLCSSHSPALFHFHILGLARAMWKWNWNNAELSQFQFHIAQASITPPLSRLPSCSSSTFTKEKMERRRGRRLGHNLLLGGGKKGEKGGKEGQKGGKEKGQTGKNLLPDRRR